jgi:hypothetical protein
MAVASTAPILKVNQPVQAKTGTVAAAQAAQPAHNAVVPVSIVQTTPYSTDSGSPIYLVLLKNNTCVWMSQDQLM